MAIDRTPHKISLTQEDLTRLIADVVTGKLGVREATARLPEEVEEPEPLDEMELELDAEDDDASKDAMI